MIREPVIMTKKEWQDYHDEPLNFTASVTAILTGDHPQATPYSEYHKRRQFMKGLPFAEPGEDHMPFLCGHALEPVGAHKLYLDYPDIGFTDPGDYAMWIHPDYPWFGVTPDRLGEEMSSGLKGVAELKSTGAFTPDAAKWRSGTVPLHVDIQNQTQMLVTGAKFGWVACVIPMTEFYSHERQWVPKTEEAIMDAVLRFRKMVMDGDEPDPSESLIDSKVIKQLHPKDNGETIELSEEAVEAAESIEGCNESIQALTKEKTGYQNKIQSEIGDATYGMRGGVKFSWKTQTRKEKLVKASEFRVLRREKVKV